MLLRMNNISKSFFDVEVLKNVNFDLNNGEVHGLIGQNGAGKSTLINILSGVYSYDFGEIYIDDKKVLINSTHDALKLGVSTIHQEPELIDYMTIAENIFLGNMPKIFNVFINYYKMKKESQKILNTFNYNIKPTTKVNMLYTNEKYIVCIARALLINSKILIMDEPTASLTESEKEILFDIIRKLKSQGVGIIYITHNLSEIPEICDRVTILRDGEKVITSDVSNTSQKEIVKSMVGKELVDYFPPINEDIGEELVKVEHLTKKNRFEDVSFYINRGEVIGFAGLVGSGRTELVKTLFGQERKDEGHIYLRGKEVDFTHPQNAIRKKIGIVNEDRINSALFMDMNVAHNLTITNLQKFNHWSFIRVNEEKDSALDAVMELDIKLRHLNEQIKYLSGGNQQKAILGRWLLTESDLFLLDEPTRGIDISARSDLYLNINDLASKGKGIIIISSDITELMGLCNRIYIMSHGKIVGELNHHEFDKERILNAMNKVP